MSRDAAASPPRRRFPARSDARRAPGVDAIPPDELTPEERERVVAVLSAEYGILAGLLGAAWSASLVRTSLFLGVVSALGVALGFAAQASGGIGPTFTAFALVALP